MNSPDTFVPPNWSWNCLSLTSWYLREINPYPLSHLPTGILLRAAKRVLTDAVGFMGKRVGSGDRLPACNVGLSHLPAVWFGEVTPQPLLSHIKTGQLLLLYLFTPPFQRLEWIRSLSSWYVFTISCTRPLCCFPYRMHACIQSLLSPFLTPILPRAPRGRV